MCWIKIPSRSLTACWYAAMSSLKLRNRAPAQTGQWLCFDLLYTLLLQVLLLLQLLLLPPRCCCAAVGARQLTQPAQLSAEHSAVSLAAHTLLRDLSSNIPRLRGGPVAYLSWSGSQRTTHPAA